MTDDVHFRCIYRRSSCRLREIGLVVVKQGATEKDLCNGAGKTTRISIGGSVTQRHMGVRGTSNKP
ncbi:hypothetical protein GGP41_000403 [Bipolaris sorokiniana]|uniref:Uncharacterized protein n=1 Tax=Cochliobolus sativus TaxID=45130 RepID=A0A8H5ZMF1_COCSA|nr:hypothetical protein GGP41_000403 [Bipolaris sorokiniana]